MICNTGHDASRAGRDAYMLLCHKERVATDAYDHIAWIDKFTRRLPEVPDSSKVVNAPKNVRQSAPAGLAVGVAPRTLAPLLALNRTTVRNLVAGRTNTSVVT
jgi:hypothetical protein